MGARPPKGAIPDLVDVWDAVGLRLRQVAAACKTPAVWLFRQL